MSTFEEISAKIKNKFKKLKTRFLKKKFFGVKYKSMCYTIRL